MKKSLNMGLIFKIFPGSLCEPLKILKKIAKNLYLFFEKIPKHEYLYLEKLPLNMGMGLELSAEHPRPIQIWEPPLPDHGHLWFISKH